MSEEMKSLSYFERKEYEELKNRMDDGSQKSSERAIFIGFFVVSLLATLMISGAMDRF